MPAVPPVQAARPAPASATPAGATLRQRLPQRIGYAAVAEIEGNKLEIDFEQSGRKRVLDSFVSLG